MAHRHLNLSSLQRFLHGEATAAQVRDLVWHLLEACPECGAAASVESLGGAAVVGTDVEGSPTANALLEASGDVVVDRVRTRIQPTLDQMRRARLEGPALFSELERHPVERQRILIRNNPRFCTLPLAELVLEVAWRRGFHEPDEADALIDLSLEILEQLGATSFGDSLPNDLRGRAWAYRGNLLRIRSSFREADEAFQRAEKHLMSGTGDPLETARLLGLKATLRRFQYRLDEASDLIRDTLEVYLLLGEEHLAGRTMVSQALLLHEQGDAAGALEVLDRAQELIDPGRDQYLVRVVQQNTVTYLMELGRYEEGFALLPALRRRAIEAGQPIELLRLRWQEGRLLLGLGHEARAEAAFLEVRKGFVEQGIANDAAAVSLELASLYLRQGRTSEIRDLVRQMVPIFQSRDLHQNAIAALLLFQRAVEMDTLTLRMVEEVADVVRRAQGNPRATQEEPS